MALFKKKPDPENLEELSDIQDDVIEGDFVPYACHWTAETLITKNGEVLQTIKIAEDTPKEADTEETDLRVKIREALKMIDATDYAVWIHTVRRKASFQSAGEYKRDFAGYLDRFWKDRNEWEHKFINEVYVTVIREGENAFLFNVPGLFRQIWPRIDIRHRENYIDASIEKLSAVVDNMVEVLAPFGARKLGVYEEDGVWYSEPCSFLNRLVTMQDEKKPVAQVSICDYITDCDVTFGYNAMEARMRVDGRRRFGAYVTIKEYRELPPDSLDSLLKMPLEFVISQAFTFINSKEALKGFEYQKKLFDMSSSSVLAARSGVQAIVASDTGKGTDFCSHQLGMFLNAESVKSLDNNVSKAFSALGALGLIPMREDIMLEECYWAMLPANFQVVKRVKPLNTMSMGGFASINFLPCGQGKDNHWGPAVSTLNTVARTPYYFNFHRGDNGHTILLGPPNSGKKVLMNFLTAQARKFDGKLVYFDRERLAEPFIRSIDGTYYNIYPGTDARSYVQLAMNPLQMDNTDANREFLARWLYMLGGAAVDEALAANVKPVLEVLMQRPKSDRTLIVCGQMLAEKNPAWAQALAPWLAGGKHASLFNHAEDALTLEGKVYGFEMENLVHHKDALTPTLAYLMHRVMQFLDGKPAMVVMDEAWDLLETPLLAPRLKGWLQALREKNAMAFMASEQIDTVRNSPINAELFKNVATKLFLPDDSADASYAEAFDLQARDVAFLAAMSAEDRQFLLVKDKEAVVLELDLAGMVDIVSVLSATPYHLQMMEQAIVARGISPTQWMPKFLESI